MQASIHGTYTKANKCLLYNTVPVYPRGFRLIVSSTRVVRGIIFLLSYFGQQRFITSTIAFDLTRLADDLLLRCLKPLPW